MLLMRNLLVVSVVFAAGVLLGGNSNENREVLRSIMVHEPQDLSLFPTEDDLKDDSQRLLIDFNDFALAGDDDDDDDEMSLFGSPIMGDDGLFYDDNLWNFENNLEILQALENHTNDGEFFDIEYLLMDEEITSIPTKEEREEPEEFLNEIKYIDTVDYERKLNNDQAFHTPLACNEGVENEPCFSFKSLIENSNKDDTLVVVPCGQCFEVDYEDGSEIVLPNGLSINGKLYFPSTASITLRTKFVWVAGLLEVR